ncbi:ABC transporter permease subunit [Agrobacterium tumefaciens]|uniref:ABC transporter permease subunit n=1 Tax=Agrobacterium tumefaciens complex TaxID=1183400 RepID=UPI000B400938|nr:hypothetical protein B7W89_20370 [Agrobacterium tumefaciens]
MRKPRYGGCKFRSISAVAAIFCSIRLGTFDPLTSPERMLSAFEAVIPGGLGPIRGTLAGGVVLGISQAAGNRWLQWLVSLQTES